MRRAARWSAVQAATAIQDDQAIAQPAEAAGARRRPVRICMIHYSDFLLDSRVQRHARALSGRGDRVDAICLSRAQRIEVGEGEIRLHQVGHEKARDAAGAQLAGYGRFCLRAALKLMELQRTERFDVIEAHNMPDAVALAAAVAKVRGSRVILDVHDTFPELFATKFGPRAARLLPLVRLEERLSAGASDAVICVTQEARERLAFRGIPLSKSHVVMNSPDENVFGGARKPVRIPETGPVRVVYHGGTAERFGVEPLIQAFGLLRRHGSRAELDVRGAMPRTDALRALARHVAPENVELADAPTPFADIPAILAEKHIGIVPTLKDEFTELLLPVKLMEYVHMGIPVIASRLPATEHYFDETEVRYVTPGSAEELAGAIEELCADPRAAAGRAARASERMKEIAWGRQRSAYLALVDGLTSRVTLPA